MPLSPGYFLAKPGNSASAAIAVHCNLRPWLTRKRQARIKMTYLVSRILLSNVVVSEGVNRQTPHNDHALWRFYEVAVNLIAGYDKSMRYRLARLRTQRRAVYAVKWDNRHLLKNCHMPNADRPSPNKMKEEASGTGARSPFTVPLKSELKVAGEKDELMVNCIFVAPPSPLPCA
jgi:hypothetical protein